MLRKDIDQMKYAPIQDEKKIFLIELVEDLPRNFRKSNSLLSKKQKSSKLWSTVDFKQW